MNIKRAKKEIINTIQAYLKKEETGDYLIPPLKQRPILLIGPPGIGKREIVKQAAKECQIGIVSYTMTHHTRQSIVGLPIVKEKNYQGKRYSVTEHTMSEMVAAIYEKMEHSSHKEGILYLDEIDSVSETLVPMITQLLQEKTLCNQEIPIGWTIVAAATPPGYNRLVREFDIPILDRMKRINLEEDLEVWKEYAYRQEIHPAIISYLELRKDSFYKVETTVDGKFFVTARGWEDLSRFIKAYEQMEKKVDYHVVEQFAQHPEIAKDFATFLELYHKYKQDYNINDILHGQWDMTVVEKVRLAPPEERLGIISLLNGRLNEMFIACHALNYYVTKLHHYLIYYRENQATVLLDDVCRFAEKEKMAAVEKGLLDKREERSYQQVVDTLEAFSREIKGEMHYEEASFAKVKTLFKKRVTMRETKLNQTGKMLEFVFLFMEDAFGESQEMAAFVTELNASYYSLWFIKEHGSDLYYRHSKGLFLAKQHQDVLDELEELERIVERRENN